MKIPKFLYRQAVALWSLSVKMFYFSFVQMDFGVLYICHTTGNSLFLSFLHSSFKYLLKLIISHLSFLFSRLNQSQVTQFLFKERNVLIPSSYLCSWHELLSSKSMRSHWAAQSWTQFPRWVLSVLNTRKDHLLWPSDNFLANATQEADLPGLYCAAALYRSLQRV